MPPTPSTIEDSEEAIEIPRDTKIKAPAARQPWENVSFCVLCAVCFVDGADKALLPASMRAMEHSMDSSPESLALLSLCQGTAVALSAPIWGNVADCGFSRKQLLLTGVVGWSAITTLLACCNAFPTFMILRFLNGCCLGMLLPVVQSLVADSTSSLSGNDLGFRFGLLDMCTVSGTVTTIVVVTAVSMKEVHSHEGWRVAYVVVAVMSLVVAGLVQQFFKEAARPWNPENFGPKKELSKLVKYFAIPSFRVIVAQGIFGTIPGQALSFLVLYMQYTGLTDFHASCMVGVQLVGCACGVVLGGLVGDKLASISEAHGRPLTAQISIALSIPIAVAIFTMGVHQANVISCACLCFLLGLVSTWVPSGCNKPVYARIIPSQSRSSAFGWSLALEATSGALIGPLLVGYLAQHEYGYEPSTKLVSEMPPQERRDNARALSSALTVATVIPWSICLLIYTRLHFTYASDLEVLNPLVPVPGPETERSRND